MISWHSMAMLQDLLRTNLFWQSCFKLKTGNCKYDGRMGPLGVNSLDNDVAKCRKDSCILWSSWHMSTSQSVWTMQFMVLTCSSRSSYQNLALLAHSIILVFNGDSRLPTFDLRLPTNLLCLAILPLQEPCLQRWGKFTVETSTPTSMIINKKINLPWQHGRIPPLQSCCWRETWVINFWNLSNNQCTLVLYEATVFEWNQDQVLKWLLRLSATNRIHHSSSCALLRKLKKCLSVMQVSDGQYMPLSDQ